MKTLIRSIVTAVLLAVIGGTVSTAGAQRVSVEVRLGTPGYHLRQYRHGHHHYRQYHHYRHYHRHYVGHHRRPQTAFGPRTRDDGRSLVVRRPPRAHRSHRYGYY